MIIIGWMKVRLPRISVLVTSSDVYQSGFANEIFPKLLDVSNRFFSVLSTCKEETLLFLIDYCSDLWFYIKIKAQEFTMELQVILTVFFASVVAVNSLKQGECEVCIKTLDKFASTLSDDVKKDPKLIEKEFKAFCKTTKNKENRFCYYLGGLEESATGILGEMSKPLSWSMPSDKVCEKLKKKDAQICELRYDVEIDLKTVDLKKLKVRDLKKIINDWGEDCQGCIEKSEFIQRIEELKAKHTEL